MNGQARSIPSVLLCCIGMLCAALALAGCAGGAPASDASQARPGVTVYGTVDAGISRTER